MYIVFSQMINQTVSFFMFLLRVKSSQEEEKEEEYYILNWKYVYKFIFTRSTYLIWLPNAYFNQQLK